MSSSAQAQSCQLQPGDLIRCTHSNDMGLVLGPGWAKPAWNIHTVNVQWSTIDEPCELDVTAIESGHVVLVSRADVTML